MAAPTITGTPVATSGFFGAGPITITGYTHTSGDDAFVAVGYSYNAGMGGPTGIARGADNYTKVAEYQHPSVTMKVEVWQKTASTVTTGNATLTLPGSSDFIGSAVAFSANGVASLGTPVYADDSFDGTLQVTVTGDVNSLMLGVTCAKRSAAFPELANNTATTGGTDIANTGYASNSNLGDRTTVFTEAGAASVDLNVTHPTQTPDRLVMLGIPLNGAGASTFFRPYFITG